MLKDRHWGCAAATLLALVVALPALAGGPASSDRDATIASLESRLAAQQEQLEQLQDRLVTARAQQEDAQRVEAMKQQIREVLSEQEFRESLMPSMVQAGYDEGFYIRSSDDMFLMKIGGLMQFRWTHYDTSSRNRYLAPRMQRNDRTGFDFQRVRINFKGHAFDPNITYLLELQSDSANPAAYDTVFSQGWIDYRFCDAFHFRAGKFKSASTRANTTAHSQLQFMSRPMVDAVFGLGFNLGVRFWGQLFDQQLDWYLDVTNSFSNGENFGSGRTITNDPAELDNNPALAFRLVWHALGEKADFKSQSDIESHGSPVLDVGFHYAFNEDEYDARTTRIPFPAPRPLLGAGGFGLTTTNGAQIHQWGLDSAFKYMGFSAIGEYVIRTVDPRRAGRRPFTPWWLLTRQGDTTAQHGAYVQLGYFLPIPGLENKLEAVARAGGISALANDREGSWEYAAGVNYYIHGQNVKLQADVTKLYEAPISSSYKSLANVNDDALIFRVQLQLAF